MYLGAIRCKIEQFMGIAEVQIPSIGVSSTGILGLLPESEFSGYLVRISVLPTNVCVEMDKANRKVFILNPLNLELNPICYLLALLGAHHFLHVSRIRVKLLTFRLLMSYIYIYIYGAPILDVSRSHTTTQHSR